MQDYLSFVIMEILRKDEKMTFEELLPKLKAGHKAVRQGWSGGEEYIRLLDPKIIEDQTITPFFVIMVENEGYSMFQPTVCDILAQDWVLAD